MPFYLKELNVVPELTKLKSAMIVICRFCPAASLALKNNRPYFEFFRSFINTPPFEEYINEIKSSLEKEGLKIGILRGNMLHSPFNFVICMWNSWQRNRFIEEARRYDAVVVLGCEAAYENLSDLLKSTDCLVYQGMETKGVFSVTPKYHWPDSITLELLSVTPMSSHDEKRQQCVFSL